MNTSILLLETGYLVVVVAAVMFAVARLVRAVGALVQHRHRANFRYQHAVVEAAVLAPIAFVIAVVGFTAGQQAISAGLTWVAVVILAVAARYAVKSVPHAQLGV